MEKNKGAAEVAERKVGFYWIKSNKHTDWVISEWSGTFWWLAGRDEPITWKPFEIDERQICRS